MPRVSRLWVTAVAIVVAGGCADSPTANEAAPEFKRDLPAAGARGLTVMTRNVYVGADVDKVLQPSEDPLPVVVAMAFAELLSTDFPTRAKALADEIAATKPHLVGLQEITLIRIQDPSDFELTPNAETVLLDFKAILLGELAARGLDYVPAVQIQDSDVELPAAKSATEFFDVRQTDFDLILVRGDVDWSNPLADNYAAALPVPVTDDFTLYILRGWTSVDATIAGRTLRFVNTHLEAFAREVRVPQAQELLFSPAGPIAESPHPVMLVGDLNADAVDVDPEDAYALLMSEGFMDVWDGAKTKGPALTCCFSSNLQDPAADFHSRIDLILTRGLEGPANGGTDWRLWSTVVGDEPRERVYFDPPGEAPGYYLWPSDHAGVVASLKLPNNGK